ncbi:MAG: VOC family protein [Solirubrobacteraceae bacterium]
MITTPPSESIAAETTMGAVALLVRDMERSRSFYEQALGLPARELGDGGLGFGPPSGDPLVILHADASALALDRRATGLFHLAIVVPSRLELASALARLAQAAWPLDGASDHLVSEALYLSDPDGNGIEIYRDRPRAEWRYDAPGRLAMATLPLDLRGLAGELRHIDSVGPEVPAGTRIGHVHLQVSDLAATEAFYHGVLGFDVMVRGYPGALFVSAGGYHHHLGLNTWNSAGSGPPRPGSLGLRALHLVLPDAGEQARLLDSVCAAGLEATTEPSGAPAVRDPSGNLVVLRAR